MSERESVLSTEDAKPEASRRCSCVGLCRGKEGLGEGWYCVLDRQLDAIEPLIVRPSKDARQVESRYFHMPIGEAVAMRDKANQLDAIEREYTQLKAAVKRRGLAVQMIDGEMVLLKTAKSIIADCSEIDRLNADLMAWQRYASYLKSCAKSGEFEPQDFDEFYKEFATKLLHAIQNVDTSEVEIDD